MPAGHIESLADAVSALPCFSEPALGLVLSAVASPAYRKNASRFLASWADAPDVPGLAVALALRAASSARADATQEETIEVVWTGPTSHEIPVRRTREVLLELIGVATQRLTVVSFAAYKVPEVLQGLLEATLRGVDIRLVLESAEDSHGRLSHDAAEAFESLRNSAAFYVWPSDRRASGEGMTGTLHAKAVIADAQAAFVTSANLTGHGLTANMELGLLVRGGAIPGRLTAHFDELVAQGTLRRVE
jgi:phosphatidylserine/phosphatidylglycerophosphate/cardiolipin synthase-like enzyme